MCFVLGVLFLVLILLPVPVLPLFSSLKWFFFSSNHPLAYLLVPVVSCKLFSRYLLSMLLVHIGTRYPLLFYIGDLIVDGGTSYILCKDGVFILPVVLEGRIMLLWYCPGWSSLVHFHLLGLVGSPVAEHSSTRRYCY